MKTPEQWISKAEPSLPLEAALTKEIALEIQMDALCHAALMVQNMSRGTRSNARSIAIDEARDLLIAEHDLVNLELNKHKRGRLPRRAG